MSSIVRGYDRGDARTGSGCSRKSSPADANEVGGVRDPTWWLTWAFWRLDRRLGSCGVLGAVFWMPLFALTGVVFAVVLWVRNLRWRR